MANKKTTTTTTTRTTRGKGWLIRACSYFALVLSALLFLCGGVFSKIFSAQVVSIFNLLGQLFLLVGIGFPAYDFTRGKKIGWKIVYWIALVVYVFGCVFGVIRAF